MRAPLVQLFWAFALLTLEVSAHGAEESLWTEYRANPNAHANLPNCSFAGYRRGEMPLPAPSGPIVDVRMHGAKGDGIADDTQAIRSAIDAVGPAGGVVFFPDGNYRVSGVLFVNTDHTILRGQSRDGTRITFTRSLNTGYAKSTRPDGRSYWSYAGGLIWFTPRTRHTYLPPGTTEIGHNWSDAWTVGPELTGITSFPARGATRLEVADGSRLAPGQLVFVELANPPDLSLLKHLAGDGPWSAHYDWSPANADKVLGEPLDWPVEVTAIEGNTIELAQPTRFDLRPGFHPRLMQMGDVIRECGIENLTLKFNRDYVWTSATHHFEPGWNGPWFNNAVDCFLRSVTLIDPDNGPGVAAAKNITFTDFRLEASSAMMTPLHHGTTCRVASNDCLFENFEIVSKPLHGINVEQMAMGNAFSHGVMQHGTFDSHRGLPLENMRTDIQIHNDGQHGGPPGGGPLMGARFVHWNVTAQCSGSGLTNEMVGQAELMPKGAIVGVRGCRIDDPGDSECLVDGSGPQSGVPPEPPNLYEAEKALRLGMQGVAGSGGESGGTPGSAGTGGAASGGGAAAMGCACRLGPSRDVHVPWLLLLAIASTLLTRSRLHRRRGLPSHRR